MLWFGFGDIWLRAAHAGLGNREFMAILAWLSSQLVKQMHSASGATTERAGDSGSKEKLDSG